MNTCFEVRSDVLDKYLGPGGEVIVPEDVLVIGPNVFSNRSDITRISLPEGSISILSSAFQNCTHLREIVFRGSVDRISSNAFKNCAELTSLSLPEGLKEILDCAFMDCASLKSPQTEPHCSHWPAPRLAKPMMLGIDSHVVAS